MDQQTTSVPQWIDQSYFLEILKESVPHFSKIQQFDVKPALSAGENYGSLMLRVKICIKLKDGTVKKMSYMMKVPHEASKIAGTSNSQNVENETYLSVLPKFESLYKAKGLEVSFAPRTYKFTENLKQEPKLADIVLMDDLGQDGYKNLNRLEGLNFEQTKYVLKKIAQFHAAGAQSYRVNNETFSKELMQGVFGSSPESLTTFATIFQSFQKSFLDNLTHHKNGDYYHAKFTKLFPELTKRIPDMGKINPIEFNTIVHGDCWINNFLFKLNNQGEFEDMRFVDFQLLRFCNPSADLLNFLITSVNIEHKLKHFDFFVYYYHSQLVEHLKILGYEAPVPTLRGLHINLLHSSMWVIVSSIMALPIVISDPSEAATTDNLVGDNASGDAFKNLLYSNKRYKMYMEQLLPWLDCRGYLDV